MVNAITEFSDALAVAGYSLPAGKTIEADDGWHRLIYMGEKVSSGRYRLGFAGDGFAIGGFGSDKDPAGFRSWHSKREGTQEISREQRQAMRKAAEDMKAQREIELVRRQARIGRLLRKALAGMPKASEHPYLEKKRIGGHGVKLRSKRGELVIPMYATTGELMNLQRITKTGWKGFFKGARVNGCCYPIGKFVDVPGSTVLICEGFATGASLHEVTGLPVRVAFNTSNLKFLASALKEKYPQARIIFCADNDAWVFAPTHRPKDLNPSDIPADDPRWKQWAEGGLLWNPGIEKAQAAAVGIGGAVVIWPEFSNTEGKPTDFNDMRVLEGDEAVKVRIAQAMQEYSPPVPVDDSAPMELPASDIPAMEETRPVFKKRSIDMAFKILGYNESQFYYYPFGLKQIVALSASGHTIQNLLQLDALESWEKPYRDNEGKLAARHQSIALYAANWMMQEAKKKGVFIEESSVRGCGAWIDDGRVILHCGDKIYCDSQLVGFDELQSNYVYVASRRMIRPAQQALTNYEAFRLRKICEAVTWENTLSGTLLAGWLVIAPICAALTYRPHIYITGEAESGKSTVMERIIKAVLGKIALCVDGGTTEASIRDKMAYDGRPLVYDEAEPSPAMADVIGLARKASTGAVVGKFGQRAFKARFCACFSAINPPVNKTADESRISFMHLKKNRRETAMQEYDDLLTMIEETITEDYPERMIARTLENLDTLIANISMFKRAMRKTIGGARASEQIGTMLAGAYLLSAVGRVTEEEAISIARRFDWHDHTIIDQEGDPTRLVQHITSSLLKNRLGVETAVGELITQVSGQILSDAQAADKILRQYGILVKDQQVFIASRSQNLAKLLKNTEWQDKWSRTLSDVAGAEKARCVYFSPGIKTSAIGLPIELFTEAETEQKNLVF